MFVLSHTASTIECLTITTARYPEDTGHHRACSRTETCHRLRKRSIRCSPSDTSKSRELVINYLL